MQPRDGGLALVAVNETARAWSGPATVTRLALTGEPRAKTSVDLDVPAYSSVVLALPAELARPDDGRAELLVADAGDAAERALWFFAEDRDVRCRRRSGTRPSSRSTAAGGSG
ncbi:hypothetical protein V2I01_22040 [Micromonospora sp. BRA006-A]|nr:hypothetical protein [Micromonospora sp. BRA006-A]